MIIINGTEFPYWYPCENCGGYSGSFYYDDDVTDEPIPSGMNACSCADCLDCGVDTFHIAEYYMVQDVLWDEVNPDVEGMLCIGCLEKRLGRILQPSDFPSSVPLNADTSRRRSFRLSSRMEGMPSILDAMMSEDPEGIRRAVRDAVEWIAKYGLQGVEMSDGERAIWESVITGDR